MSNLPHTMPTPEQEATCNGCREWGKDLERERIIKLLEGLVAERKGTTPSYALLEAIALIKGENNG